MSSSYLKVHSRFTIMLVTGIILAPTAFATPAVQDLVDLRTIINVAANTIGNPNNPNRGWGFGLLGGGGNQMGTADLINNITTTILRSKFQLNTNKTSWLLPDNTTNATGPSKVPLPPTLPLTSSILLPPTAPAAPTATPTLGNITKDLSASYIDYISSIPNLSSGLTTLGRSYHKEMNAPIYQAIDALQQSISAFQSTILQSELISSQAIIRTIRASGSLEDAQQAWSRFLNLPGRVSSPGGDTGGSDDVNPVGIKKRAGTSTRPPSAEGRHYTHKELWGRDELKARQSKEGKPRWSDAIVRREEQRAWIAEHARVERPYVA
ncbi:uncharacterized protein K460DRAFT_375375 [Cucurbitaria berberidis CBS 394.84]|uniref:Uncharacterized protein n=1 Tax=Cucurbitaria berberidis CBS 394.84 TaxID=1168544 RepID=A0A9P4GMT3_9PLEO|nr:uncharacterized protein K460DRAFT_375375 [Cucurbitaria berberidis CBS 394.84]KAF1848522.1 hypothetical protein K460DRAFT_375375 [Cucurbitaria berberidis CBS 394.84]